MRNDHKPTECPTMQWRSMNPSADDPKGVATWRYADENETKEVAFIFESYSEAKRVLEIVRVAWRNGNRNGRQVVCNDVLDVVQSPTLKSPEFAQEPNEPVSEMAASADNSTK